MRYFLIDDGEGPSLVRVPKGKELVDLGYSEDVIAAAEERPRAPRDFETWDAEKWVIDEEAKAKAETDAELAALAPSDLCEMIVELATERLRQRVQVAVEIAELAKGIGSALRGEA